MVVVMPMTIMVVQRGAKFTPACRRRAVLAVITSAPVIVPGQRCAVILTVVTRELCRRCRRRRLFPLLLLNLLQMRLYLQPC